MFVTCSKYSCMQAFEVQKRQAGEDMRCYYYSYGSQQQIIRNFSLMYFTLFSSCLFSLTLRLYFPGRICECVHFVSFAWWIWNADVCKKVFLFAPQSLAFVFRIKSNILYTFKIKENIERGKHTAM